MTSMTTQPQMPQLTLDDLHKHGWAAEAFSAYFNVNDGRQYDYEVLTHLDSIVMERGNETLRSMGQNTTLRERLEQGGAADAALVTLTLNNVITQMVLQCKTFDGVYRMAKDSLYEQQFNMALSVAKTATHRLADMEDASGLGANPTVQQMATAALANPEIERLSHELTGCLQQMLTIHNRVREYEPVGAGILMRAVNRKLAISPWYQFGMSMAGATVDFSAASAPTAAAVAKRRDMAGPDLDAVA